MLIRLCSSSPTRAKILKDSNINFTQSTPNFDEEQIKINTPKEFVYQATKGKFEAGISEFGSDIPLLACDTVVVVGNEVLRKPRDINDAKYLLELQSANSVSIVTCMMFVRGSIRYEDIISTTYEFAKFDEVDLQEYLSSEDWRGKAGGIMVEGFAKKYILSVDGYESTAKGLCVEALRTWL
ncbi:MAG: Septum formation protein Maf [uncultured Campylobacterales bacterium]|uniref:Septum formation protein Maf n=1 Tax=uncultured Campylobacterales bacterium TaxID=352960 RepID=A0A6S6T623_9BACT|nr:MAG: Septum formation protein Maf [uncultured Campylobacterales bacterium]